MYSKIGSPTSGLKRRSLHQVLCNSLNIVQSILYKIFKTFILFLKNFQKIFKPSFNELKVLLNFSLSSRFMYSYFNSQVIFSSRLQIKFPRVFLFCVSTKHKSRLIYYCSFNLKFCSLFNSFSQHWFQLRFVLIFVFIYFLSGRCASRRWLRVDYSFCVLRLIYHSWWNCFFGWTIWAHLDNHSRYAQLFLLSYLFNTYFFIAQKLQMPGRV